MALNYNVDPYYDDFDSSKNYHRILFKPGRAVQARELTQAQTILQDQITKFADNIFKQNSPVTGGQVTTNFGVFYIKLQDTYLNNPIDVSQFQGLLVQNDTGTVLARVLQVSAAANGDAPTIIVSYLSGSHFTDNDVIYDVNSNLAAQALDANSTGQSSVASISQGVFYVLGNFVQVPESTIILGKYSSSPSMRVGLTITETTQDYIGDPSLLDPAVGASNFQAPGADRYLISLALDSRPLTLGDDQDFIELVRITEGSVAKMVDGSVYNVIDDYFAKRDYETNGDYVVNDFKLTPKTNDDPTKYTLSVGKGLAYVHGYRLENQAPLDIVSDRARTTNSHNNSPVSVDFGSYFYVDTVQGANGSFFDITTTQSIDLHCVDKANVNITDANHYNATLIGTGYIRGLVYDHNTSDIDSTTFVYKAYVHDIQNASPSANAAAGGTNTITLPSNYSSSNSAYIGVNISITTGPSAGDFRTITGYNGVTKVATVNQNWTTTPTTSSVFTLNFDIKDVETVMDVSKTSFPATIYGTAKINPEGKKNGLSTGDTILENPTVPEMLFNVGSPYVASMVNASYTSQQIFRNVSFTSSGGSVTAQLNYEGAYVGILRHFGNPGSTLSPDLVKQNFTIVVTNPLSSGLTTGQIIPWTSTGRTITLDNDASIATLAATDLNPFTATIIEKVYIENADSTGIVLKGKNLITANTTAVYTSGTNVNTYTFVDDATLTSTGQVYIQHAGLVTPGNKQSLYLSDVKQIVKIIDTGSSGVVPTNGMLTNPLYDITNNYTFNNGQKDAFYDHAYITLKPGAPQPSGNILVLVDYYQHTGGDGYFNINSYLSSAMPEHYQNIPQYISRHGTIYNLRDCIDFRPARKNAQASFAFRYANPADTKHGAYLPVDLTTFVSDYTYYLGRKDKLVLSKDRSFQIIQGAPSLTPLFPAEPDGSLVIANLVHNPYTGYIPTEAPTGVVPDLSVTKVKHKRYTMQDIAGLENRINNVEYYTSLNMLEQNTQSLQIPDSYGINRFKNGILVDDFSSYATADTVNLDYSASINRRTRQMTALQSVENFPLKSLALAYNMSSISSATANGLGYSVNTDGYVNYFSLPYTSELAVAQKLASRTVNVNPFSFSVSQGITTLSPNMDNWVDNTVAPALLITDPNLQVFRANSSSVNVMSAGDWKTISGTSYVMSVVSRENHGRYNGVYGTNVGQTETTTYTELNQVQSNILGPYDNLGNTYSLNNGYITDISVLPYIRAQQIVTRAKGLLVNTPVNTFFDTTDVNNFVRKTNIIELTNVSGSFSEEDTLGYYTSGSFHPTARVLGVYNYPGTSNTRLYVAADGQTTSYTTNGVIQNGFYDTNGAYQSNTAAGSLVSSKHFGGMITNVDLANNQVKLAGTASTTNNYYTGNTIFFNSGTGVGQSATISNYIGANQTAILATTVSSANGDIYSIGSFNTDETGSFYGIFNLPANSFHTGQRVFRVDNSINGNPTSATTFAEGTFYSEGLQTTSQGIDFGASPSGAKGVFTQTNYANTSSIITTYSPYDPVAQTFIVSKDNYPNGLFLNNVKLFFATKPTSDNSTITISIVGTQNGYPNGETLDHSLVTLHPSEVVVSQTPQYLDSTSYTVFKFNAPVYIQPGVLYAFIVKSNSSEYTLWTASNGDNALSSSVKNLPTDPLPSTITKISSAPYVGSLFLSQNSQTWTADQNQDLMFVMERCKFNTAANPTIQYVVPNKLPNRTLVDQSIEYFLNANNVSDVTNSVSSTDILVDAFNITTTDFTPTTTTIDYSYNATLLNGTFAGVQSIVPGKFGTATSDDIYLNDGNGERVLSANSNTSFSVYTSLSSADDAVSPIVSDAGLSVYAIQWNVNNCELSNSNITLVSGGSSYSSTPTVTVSAPTGKNGVQAYAAATVVGGVITSVYFTQVGSGYITTPTLTITDGTGSNASAIVTGETSHSGGNAAAKYVSKKVVLDAGFDSGDLNVYLTAYRPVNTDINVYYKILNRNDTQNFDDGQWQLMTKTNSSDTSYSKSRSDNIEYTFAPGTNGTDQGYVSYTSTTGQTYNSFSQFAVKVVLTSTDHTYCPVVNDLRVIALPSNTNTTV